MFLRKSAGMVAMALSAVMLIALLAFICGTWILRGAVLEGAAELAAVGDRALVRGQTAIAQLTPQLSRAETRLDEGVTQIEAAGAAAEQADPVIALAEAILREDLDPALARLEEQGANLRDTIIILDETIGLLQRLPLTRPDAPLLAQADAAIEQVRALGQRIEEANQAVASARSQRLDKLVQSLTSPLLRARDGFRQVQAQLDQLSARLSDAQVRLPALLQQLAVLSTWIAAGVTLLLLWLAFSQVSLFLHAYRFFRTPPRQVAGASLVKAVSSL